MFQGGHLEVWERCGVEKDFFCLLWRGVQRLFGVVGAGYIMWYWFYYSLYCITIIPLLHVYICYAWLYPTQAIKIPSMSTNLLLQPRASHVKSHPLALSLFDTYQDDKPSVEVDMFIFDLKGARFFNKNSYTGLARRIWGHIGSRKIFWCKFHRNPQHESGSPGPWPHLHQKILGTSHRFWMAFRPLTLWEISFNAITI